MCDSVVRAVVQGYFATHGDILDQGLSVVVDLVGEARIYELVKLLCDRDIAPLTREARIDVIRNQGSSVESITSGQVAQFCRTIDTKEFALTSGLKYEDDEFSCFMYTREDECHSKTWWCVDLDATADASLSGLVELTKLGLGLAQVGRAQGVLLTPLGYPYGMYPGMVDPSVKCIWPLCPHE